MASLNESLLWPTQKHFQLCIRMSMNRNGRGTEVQLLRALLRVETYSKLWVGVQRDCLVLLWEKESVWNTHSHSALVSWREMMSYVGGEAYTMCHTHNSIQLHYRKSRLYARPHSWRWSTFQSMCDGTRNMPSLEQWEPTVERKHPSAAIFQEQGSVIRGKAHSPGHILDFETLNHVEQKLQFATVSILNTEVFTKEFVKAWAMYNKLHSEGETRLSIKHLSSHRKAVEQPSFNQHVLAQRWKYLENTVCNIWKVKFS